MTYEYAGFKFLVDDNGQGDVVLRAEPGQHPAAYKQKHLTAARACYLHDKLRRPPRVTDRSAHEERHRMPEDSTVCECGHAIEEHGHDPKHPGSTACTECDCICYEPGEEDE